MLSVFKRLSIVEAAPLMRASFSSSAIQLNKRDLSSKKTKKKKSPYAHLKKPKSSYLLFSIDYRKQHASQFAGQPAVKSSSIIGEKWKELSDSAKAPYIHAHEVEKKEYEAKKAEVVAASPPPKPATGFIAFAVENRKNIISQNPGKSFAEIGAEVGKAWRSLSESERQVYLDDARAKMEDWKAQHGAN